MNNGTLLSLQVYSVVADVWNVTGEQTVIGRATVRIKVVATLIMERANVPQAGPATIANKVFILAAHLTVRDVCGEFNQLVSETNKHVSSIAFLQYERI